MNSPQSSPGESSNISNPGLLHVLAGTLLLPVTVFVVIPLNIIRINASEISFSHSLYLPFVIGFAVLYVFCLGLRFSGIRRKGGGTWAIWLPVVVAVNVIAWDLLGATIIRYPIPVAAAAVIEIAVFGITVVIARRVNTRALLTFAAIFAVLQVATTTATLTDDNVYSRAASTIKRLITGTEATLPRLSLEMLKSVQTEEMPGAVDLGAIRPEKKDGIRREGGITRVESDSGRNIYAAYVPIRLGQPMPAHGYVKVRARVAEGKMGMGVQDDDTSRWVAYATVSESKAFQDIFLALPKGSKPRVLIVFNAREEDRASRMEIESATAFRTTGLIAAASTGAALSPRRSGASPPEVKGNVYHVILDSFQRELFPYLKARGPENAYEGFTFYENFSTNFTRTFTSIPFMMNSKSFYRPGRKISDWVNFSFQNGVLLDLWNGGVGLWSYPYFDYYCLALSGHCVSAKSMRAKVLKERANLFVLDLVFLGVLPTSIRAILQHGKNVDPANNTTWEYGFSLTNAVFEMTDDVNNVLLQRRPNIFTYFSFVKLIEDEAKRPTNGQFVFTHIYIPHPPYYRDSDCTFPALDSARQKAIENPVTSHECAAWIVRTLAKKLKELGRFDDSLIIVTSDHGHAHHVPFIDGDRVTFPTPKNYNREESETYSSALVEGHSSGLLLVKLPGSSRYSISSQPAQTMDIAPTILDYFGLPADDYLGVPLQSMPADFDRTKRVWESGPFDRNANLTYFSEYEMIDGQWVFKRTIPVSESAAH